MLSQQRDAMAADSVIILDEAVVPETGVDSKIVNRDVVMLSFACSLERTEEHWRQLLGGVGLRIRNVVCYDEETKDSLIFAVKA